METISEEEMERVAEEMELFAFKRLLVNINHWLFLPWLILIIILFRSNVALVVVASIYFFFYFLILVGFKIYEVGEAAGWWEDW